jgi:cytochrome c biogenesis protein
MNLVENLRWVWRQLTSMRTALVLLFLLAVASVPGSLFPQRGTSPLRVTQFFRDNPEISPIMDRFYLFDVFASPWFGAIYLLLFISLAGCVLPRLRVHWSELRSLPPAAPKNLNRLPVHQEWVSPSTKAEILVKAAADWKKKGWRIRQGEDWISAERGYSRETGNLLFHLALLVVLVAVGFGSATGYRGVVIVREGAGFANNVTQYDTYTPGRNFDPANMPPFSFVLDEFTAEFQRGGMQNGSARMFIAEVSLKKTPDVAAEKVSIEVNKPMRVNGTSVYIVGHGFAPEFTVKNSAGEIVWQDAAVFLPQDGSFTSTGVIKVPDTVPQIGLQGFFLPTLSEDFTMGPKSQFPAADRPAAFLNAWIGDLGLDNGLPQSVYRLETENMEQIGIEGLFPGQTWELPQGQGTVEFTGLKQWASFSIAQDSGKVWALLASILAIIGLTLSLLIPRRRAWLRVCTSESGDTICEVAGLAKTEAPGLQAEVEKLAAQLK